MVTQDFDEPCSAVLYTTWSGLPLFNIFLCTFAVFFVALYLYHVGLNHAAERKRVVNVRLVFGVQNFVSDLRNCWCPLWAVLSTEQQMLPQYFNLYLWIVFFEIIHFFAMVFAASITTDSYKVFWVVFEMLLGALMLSIPLLLLFERLCVYDADQGYNMISFTMSCKAMVVYQQEQKVLHAMEEGGSVPNRAGNGLDFPGQLVREQQFFIASFPGKYESEWQEAIMDEGNEIRLSLSERLSRPTQAPGSLGSTV
eukprot:g704.t1